MRTINTTFTTFGASVLLLGYKGDSNATEILIDCAAALEEYDGTMAAMSITGPDGTEYPGDITMDENGIVRWVVAARDCGKAGHGSARIELVDDHDTVVASAEATTIIMKTKMQGIAPDQIADWTEAASVALQELRNALLDLYDGDETARVNEAARQLAEEGRISREQQRVTAETARANAESERAAAETARTTAESGRVTAESGRVTAESGRVTAESGRVTAENARVSEFNTIRANAQAALSYIGPSEASSTASAEHPSGSYFTYNGVLHKATADIASGDTITPGTNCTQVPGGAMGEVSNFKSELDHIIDITESKNLFNISQLTLGKYLDSATGALSDLSGRDVTGFIDVIPGKYLVFSVLNTVSQTRADNSAVSVCFYNESKTPISGGGTWKQSFIVPSTAKYARVCITSDVKNYDYQIELSDDTTFTEYEPYHDTIYTLDPDITVPQDQVTGLIEALANVTGVADDVTELKSQMERIAITQDYDEPVHQIYTGPYTLGHIAPDGTFYSGDWIQHTDKIPVKPGYVLTGRTTDNSQYMTFRYVCAYNGEEPVPSAGNQSDLSTYTVPDGIDFVVVSQRTAVPTGKVVCVDIKGFDAEESTNIKANPIGFMQASGNMNDGDILHVQENNVKNEVVVAFSGNITTFGKLFIGQRSDTGWKSTYIEIDNTNVVLHTDLGNATFAHGLTITDDIQVIIRTEQNAETSLIRVASHGEFYNDTTPHRWLCDEGYASAMSEGSVLTDCVLSWTSRRIDAPIWIFGDSYTSLYDSRWVYYLFQDGFDNVLLNGYAGEQSSAAMTALVNLIQTHKPKYIFWILGMNNVDTSSAVNESWKENYDLLINLCKKWNITPVLGTIPSIPTATNEFKNTIIRESGYRYVDFAKAVDPDGNGTWITGALSADGVHPTAIGAKILYMRALADFPELTVK